MEKKHFTDEKIAYALRQQEAGTPVAELMFASRAASGRSAFGPK